VRKKAAIGIWLLAFGLWLNPDSSGLFFFQAHSIISMVGSRHATTESIPHILPAHQGSPSEFGITCRGGWSFDQDGAASGTKHLKCPHRSPADKLPRSNTTPTQRHAVPRAEHQTLPEISRIASVRPEESAPLLSRRVQSRAPRMKTYWVYIMSNKSRRLYVGFTSKLPWRVFQHKNKLYPDSFTAQYEFYMLVWCEPFGSPISARMREVEIKGWRREKKEALIRGDFAVLPRLSQRASRRRAAHASSA